MRRVVVEALVRVAVAFAPRASLGHGVCLSTQPNLSPGGECAVDVPWQLLPSANWCKLFQSGVLDVSLRSKHLNLNQQAVTLQCVCAPSKVCSACAARIGTRRGLLAEKCESSLTKTTRSHT